VSFLFLLFSFSVWLPFPGWVGSRSWFRLGAVLFWVDYLLTTLCLYSAHLMFTFLDEIVDILFGDDG